MKIKKGFEQIIVDLRQASASKVQVDTIVNAMVDSVMILDPFGVIQTVNQATVRLLGYNECELLGQPSTLILGNDPKITVEELQAMKKINNIETHFRSKSGQEIPIRFSSTTIHQPDGQIDGWVCVALDMTEYKRASRYLKLAYTQVSQANRLKTEFLSNISHELRTPIAVIFGYAQMLQEGNYGVLTADQQEAIDIIANRSDELASLINMLIAEAKLRDKELLLSNEAFSLSELVEATFSNLVCLAQTKGLTFTYQIAPDLPDMLLGDRPHLHQILFNLVSNAIKFTEVGSVHVCIHATCHRHWAICVSDTGPGIRLRHSLLFLNPSANLMAHSPVAMAALG
ncbi:MAG: histidine kinase dimerization/phospho-acceptor domain-containing protein [Chloroflexota bacterium]